MMLIVSMWCWMTRVFEEIQEAVVTKLKVLNGVKCCEQTSRQMADVATSLIELREGGKDVVMQMLC